MRAEASTLRALPTALPPRAALVVLARSGDVLAYGAPALPPDETARIARFQRPQDRAARTVAHGLLRLLLTPLLGRAPQEIVLVRDALGRPALPAADGYDVNLSHGGGWVAVGIAHAGRIGVDVEDGAAVRDWARILPLFAHPTERAALGAPLDPAAALRLWALKEACLKASGEGFATAPSELCLPIGPEPLAHAHAGHALRLRTHRLPDGAWLAVATAGIDAGPRLIVAAP